MSNNMAINLSHSLPDHGKARYYAPMKLHTFFTCLLLPAALLLTSCMPGPVGKPVPKWTPPVDVPRYGDWLVEPEDCSLHASSSDVQAESTGKLQSGRLIPLKLTFLMPLVRPPVVSLSGIPVPLPLDGSQWTFRTYLDYSPNSVAAMNEPGNFVVVSYQPLNTLQPREVHFDTRGLMDGVAHIARVCR
ncbi:MAG: hypothetical protein WAZ18_05740 [Alphaproteobacteria bacterium]